MHKKLSDYLLRRELSRDCDTWPACPCGRIWSEMADRFEKWEHCTPSDDEWLAVQSLCKVMLACVSVHAPDPDARRHALLQLMQPVFADDQS